MPTKHYIIKKIGDQYIPVLQDNHPKITRTTTLGWGTLLVLLGLKRKGLFRAVLILPGLSLLIRGTCNCDWLEALFAKKSAPARNGPRHQSPSYQNDQKGRAHQQPADAIDEQLMESFPASDPPAHSMST